MNYVQIGQEILKLERNWDKFELEHLAVVDEEPEESAQNATTHEEAAETSKHSTAGIGKGARIAECGLLCMDLSLYIG